MDLNAVRMLVKVAELGSFTRAGEHLGISKARISLGVQALEAEIGCRLLQRTTRAVRLTTDGEAFVARSVRLLDEADELASMFQTPRNLRGTVRIDLPANYASRFVIPRLPEFLATHPNLAVQVSATDRRVDLVREGFDCVLRIGQLVDSGLVARRIGALPMVNCASPSYLSKHGIPRTLGDLEQHLVIHYSLRFGTDTPGFEYRGGDRYRELPMRAHVTVNSADAYLAACFAGLGIIQVPLGGATEGLATGNLVQILPEFVAAPLPVSIVHAQTRHLPQRVRAIMTWLEQVMRPHLEKQTASR